MIHQIQKAPPGSLATPLFLFHDASGTISSYCALGSMARDVYAIVDDSTEHDTFESLQTMSLRYYAAIKFVVPEGSIILGGWSLGGMIALQVAWIFARDPKVHVDGIIMVDSPYPDYSHVVCLDAESPISEEIPLVPSNKLETSILRSVNMLHRWKAPVWRRGKQPYLVMLCASQHIGSGTHPALSFIDQFRDSPTLGWNERVGSMIVNKSYSISGHHFNIFDPNNVDSTTKMISSVAVEMELLAS